MPELWEKELEELEARARERLPAKNRKGKKFSESTAPQNTSTNSSMSSRWWPAKKWNETLIIFIYILLFFLITIIIFKI
jgi:hypothetical protein